MSSFFHPDEFKCKCNANNGAGCGLDITDEFKLLVIKARKLANTPFIINSGARCKDHNRVVGGKSTSSHLVGLAVDIKCTGSRERSLIMNSFCKVGVDRFGIADTFIHIDIDNQKDSDVTWLYK